MERNADLQRLAAHFVGDFTITITNQWWVEDPDAVVTGTAHGSWIDDDGGLWVAGGQTLSPPYDDGILLHRGTPVPVGVP